MWKVYADNSEPYINSDIVDDSIEHIQSPPSPTSGPAQHTVHVANCMENHPLVSCAEDTSAHVILAEE